MSNSDMLVAGGDVAISEVLEAQAAQIAELQADKAFMKAAYESLASRCNMFQRFASEGEAQIADLKRALDTAWNDAMEEAVWFAFDENTGEFTGEYCSVKPHDHHRYRAYVRALAASPLSQGGQT